MAQSPSMDTAVIREINKLWLPVYPGLAAQVAEHCKKEPAKILEVGCFSGGIGLELLGRFPRSRLTVALDIEDLLHSFADDWEHELVRCGRERVEVISAALVPLDLPDGAFDLAVCRGIFFFLDSQGSLIKEISRLLSSGGTAFVGGGYGSHTPDEIIREVGDESRKLNLALGKRAISSDQFRAILASAGVAHRTVIVEEGGLWAVIRGTEGGIRPGALS